MPAGTAYHPMLILTCLTGVTALVCNIPQWRTSTAAATPPSFSSSPGCSLVQFQLLSVADVVAAVGKLPYKQCDSDAMPTCLLKDCADVLAPFLVELFNQSLRNGSVPSVFKAAYVTPLWKKPD